MSILDIFKKAKSAPAPFHDAELGVFESDDSIWISKYELDGQQIELAIGENEEQPEAEMLETCKFWINSWPAKKEELLAYVDQELKPWRDDGEDLDSEKFVIDSIQALWKDDPKTCMIYFTYPGDEYRHWHITLEGEVPCGFAYDD